MRVACCGMVTGKEDTVRLILKPPSEQLYVELLAMEASCRLEGVSSRCNSDGGRDSTDDITFTGKLSAPERKI